MTLRKSASLWTSERRYLEDEGTRILGDMATSYARYASRKLSERETVDSGVSSQNSSTDDLADEIRRFVENGFATAAD